MPTSYDAVLYDLDGTLLDSFGLILESFRHTRRVHFGDAIDDSIFRNGIGTPLRAQLGTMARSDAELEAMVTTYVTHNLEHHDSLVAAYDGAVESVEAFRAAGIKLALVTSKMRRGAQMGLRFLGLMDAFQVQVCADDVVRGKPDPEPVRLALSQLGVAPERAAFVGDSPHDILSGNAAGVTTVAASWGPFPEQALRDSQPSIFAASPMDVLDKLR
ncbi:MAG: HAD-IA family hydrolase [Polyangiales bacterium]